MVGAFVAAAVVISQQGAPLIAVTGAARCLAWAGQHAELRTLPSMVQR